jgi:hypothetical protein
MVRSTLKIKQKFDCTSYLELDTSKSVGLWWRKPVFKYSVFYISSPSTGGTGRSVGATFRDKMFRGGRFGG